MESVYRDKQECCGCTACKSICPANAITMKPDREGFLYPVVDQDLCIDCGLCIEVCAFQSGYDKSENLDVPYVYGVKHKDDTVRMNSQSGGIFTAVSDYVLDKGGVVYGARFRDHFVVCHKRAADKEERDEFRGSKYVQSDLDDIFLMVKDDLDLGKEVLFSGTPCQTAGLKLYLKKSNTDVNKLLLCDIICLGTPSPKIWANFVDFMERKYGGEVHEAKFRNKMFGWRAHRATFVINNKMYDSDVYARMFGRGDIIRPSCFQCIYSNLIRPSDITMGDFWGIEETEPSFEDSKGVSLVFANTPKGKSVFDNIKDKLDCIECTTDSVLQPSLQRPCERPETRDQFWSDYYELGFDYVVKKYGQQSFLGRVKVLVKKTLQTLGLWGSVEKLRGSK